MDPLLLSCLRDKISTDLEVLARDGVEIHQPYDTCWQFSIPYANVALYYYILL